MLRNDEKKNIVQKSELSKVNGSWGREKPKIEWLEVKLEEYNEGIQSTDEENYI